MRNFMQSEFFEDEHQKENFEDIPKIENKDFSSIVLNNNDWTTETIINQINKGKIRLNPSFQRRDAWDKKRKSSFIESLIIGLPIPQLVLAEEKDKRGSYIVLDGKQRLLSIRQFAADNNDENFEQLKLQKLEIRSDLNSYSLSSLQEDPNKCDDLSAFENQPIRTVVIKNWPSEEFLYQIFLRLNTGSVPLSPQELRQALHPGDFVTTIDKLSADSESLKDILKIEKPDFRMRDAELLLRFISFKNFLSEYSGTLKIFLDNTCLHFNKNWESENEKIINQIRSLEDSHQFIKQIFKNNAYRKWSASGYENRFNRAIFDIMSVAFSIKENRDLCEPHMNSIEEAFKTLCTNDIDFKTSIETTTKSIGATEKRFNTWKETLEKITGREIKY